jgi:hypothetical protein
VYRSWRLPSYGAFIFIRVWAIVMTSCFIYRFETSSDGVPLAVLTKGEVPMMRVVAELMIAANAAVATRVFAHTPAYAFVRRHGEILFKAFDVVRCRAGRVERSCAGEVAG